MSKVFDPNKPAQTRCGYPVTLLKTDVRGVASLIGFFSDPAGEEVGMTWCATGERDWASARPTALDLVNVPEIRQLNAWLILWKSGRITSSLARPFWRDGIFAVHLVNISLKEGEGFPEETV